MGNRVDITFTPEELAEAHRQYLRQWQRANKDKLKGYRENYIIKKAKEIETQRQEAAKNGNK